MEWIGEYSSKRIDTRQVCKQIESSQDGQGSPELSLYFVKFLNDYPFKYKAG